MCHFPLLTLSLHAFYCVIFFQPNFFQLPFWAPSCPKGYFFPKRGLSGPKVHFLPYFHFSPTPFGTFSSYVFECLFVQLFYFSPARAKTDALSPKRHFLIQKGNLLTYLHFHMPFWRFFAIPILLHVLFFPTVEHFLTQKGKFLTKRHFLAISTFFICPPPFSTTYIF